MPKTDTHESKHETHKTSHTRTTPLSPTHATSGTIGKKRPPTGDPVAFAKEPLPYESPPALTRNNLVLPLEVIAPDAADAAQRADKLVFHAIGDTGGIHGTQSQEAIAEVMEAQIANAPSGDKPSFYFNLGDVVYYNGQSENYAVQFYEPYQYYPAPIFAIPGNHDGDTHVRKGDQPDGEASLFGFMQNFCDSSSHPVSPYRQTMTQPYVYFRLDCPFVTIIGLYSNIGGSLDARGTNEQQQWFEDQLQAAPKGNKVIIAVHHPPFSLDAVHGGYPDIITAIDRAVTRAKRPIHGVLSGHVHNYQRFSRSLGGHDVPYIVAGAGGYPTTPGAMHQFQKGLRNIELPYETQGQGKELGVTLQSYNVKNPGFLRVTATPDNLTYDYFEVPFDGSPPAKPYDTVTVTY